MQPHPRYEILTPLATGDFATVYRGIDRELGREVAVKQIHAQFLHDPRQLDLYWREAQLLATLEHPHIMTIYDLVRDRGWLILELMQGTVREAARGEPIDLDQLREVLSAGLKALSYLHSRKVIHGDIKPSNLFFDRRGQVKIGDFGLARRATSEQGSLLKGTTKYMAPELVADQFGPVGPHSDLYSLGFSAYELMCGPGFEQLFPGLGAPGQDKQLQWLMWQAAPDRRLPDISRLLEGVPPDLAHVVQRLTEKNTQVRYRTAAEALRDLKTGNTGAEADLDEENAALAEQKARRKKRIMVFAALGSMLLSSLLLLLPTSQKHHPQVAAKPEDQQGILRNIIENPHTIVLETPTSDPEKPLRPEIAVHNDARILINDQAKIFYDLKVGDQITVRNLKDDKGHSIQEIVAARPREDQGVVVEVLPDEGRLRMKVADSPAGDQLDLTVPPTAELQLNGKPKFGGQPVTLTTLKPGDRITVQHYPEEQVEKVRTLSALRDLALQGIIRQIDPAKKEISLTLGTEENGALTVLNLAPRCEITLNGMRFLDKRTLVPGDLHPGDRVTLEHDTLVKRIDAQRQLNLTGVIRNLRYDVHAFDLTPDRGGDGISVIAAPDAPVQLSGELATFDDLRPGDRVTIAHDTADKKSVTAVSITATRPVDLTKGLLIVANQNYDDTALGQFPLVKADADLLQGMLIKRYGLSPDRAAVLTDETRIRLEQAVPQALERLRSSRQLIVYYTGAAFVDEVDEKHTVYLAPRECSLSRLATTGIPLKWLIDTLEAAPVAKKILYLDVCRGQLGGAAKQPSTAEMVASILGTRKNPGLKTVTVIASCSAGERGHDLKDHEHGAFAYYLAEGFSGAGDKNRDLILDTTEAFDFLKQSLGNATAEMGGAQTPALFAPDTTPLRITKEAKDEMERLASYIAQPEFDLKIATEIYDRARAAAPKQPEPKILYALAIFRAMQVERASSQSHEKTVQELHDKLLAVLTDLKLNFSQFTTPWELAAWLYLEKNGNGPALTELTQVISHLPPVKSRDDIPAKQYQPIFQWAGRIREYVETLAPANKRPSADALAALDAAVDRQGNAADRAYAMGREAVAKTRADFDQKIETANDDSKQFQLKIDRARLRNYLSFPLDIHIKRALSSLDD
ncbi:MAG TPA: serine/threonine-protein kinase [Pirellulales bacterium]|jgi:serine/threonine-protein kinase|nr:serine/threonine-protein kinase [Pirellulales bacterium]